MQKIWENYTETLTRNKQRAEMEAIKAAKPFLNLCLRQFHVRREYWEEFYSFLLMDFLRALDSYKPETGVKIFGWVWRLCSQSAWRYIRDKQKSLDKEKNVYALEDYQEETNELTPEAIYLQNEEFASIEGDVRRYLSAIYRNPIEIELYMRMNGLCGYMPTTNAKELAEQMNLSERTVEQLQTRNSNDGAAFRKWLRDNQIEKLNFDILADYRRYALTKRKK